MRFTITRLFFLTLFTILICLPFQTGAENLEPMETVLGQNRSNTADIVYFNNNDMLQGEIMNKDLNIHTEYGLVRIPAGFCAGLSVQPSQLITTNYNIISGELLDNAISFRMDSSKAVIKLKTDKIKQIIFKKRKEEADFLKAKQNSNLYLMSNLDLLTGTSPDKSIVIDTDYAEIPVALSQIQSIEIEKKDENDLVRIKNGDMMQGRLNAMELTIDLDIGFTIDLIGRQSFSKVLVGDSASQILSNFNIQRKPLEKKEALPEALAVEPELPAKEVAAIPAETQEPIPQGAVSISEATPGKKITNALGMEFVYIPPGDFLMGSPLNERNRYESETQHRVKLSKGFYLQTTEVTQLQWHTIMGENPSEFNGNSGDAPVESVSWTDVQAFIEQLNKKNPSQRYRLPSSAEWEYACRAETTSAYSFGDDPGQLAYFAWFNQNSEKQTHAVGQRKPNPWGLYDMHGNVWEWCLDWKDDAPAEDAADPDGPSSGEYKVLRGGSWADTEIDNRSANIGGSSPEFGLSDIGFRLVLIVK